MDERAESAWRDFPLLIANAANAVNILFSTILSGWTLHGETHLGVACVTHTVKAANDYMAGLYLTQRGMYAQAANQVRAGFETALQGAWLHVRCDRLRLWWEGKPVGTTKEIRSDLPSADVRDHLYRNLSELAHPRRRSINSLMTREIDPKQGRGIGMTAPYDERATADLLATCLQCICIGLHDFEQLHEPVMNTEQRAFWRQCVDPIFEYHDVELPRQMRRFTEGAGGPL